MLVGNKVVLRTVRESDLGILFELTADVRDAGDHWPLQLRSERAARRRFEENGWWDDQLGVLLITDREDRILGQIVMFKAFLFETKTIDRIQATTLPENEGSQRVLEKCGFAFEGIMRRAMFHRGRS